MNPVTFPTAITPFSIPNHLFSVSLCVSVCACISVCLSLSMSSSPLPLSLSLPSPISSQLRYQHNSYNICLLQQSTSLAENPGYIYNINTADLFSHSADFPEIENGIGDDRYKGVMFSCSLNGSLWRRGLVVDTWLGVRSSRVRVLVVPGRR